MKPDRHQVEACILASAGGLPCNRPESAFRTEEGPWLVSVSIQLKKDLDDQLTVRSLLAYISKIGCYALMLR